MTESVEKLQEKLLKQVSAYLNETEVSKITSAIEFAKSAHEGQYRKSKKPYIIHPIHVASILAEMEQGCDAIIAGLLHDTIEDTKVSLEDISDQFGKNVSFLVEGVTKLSKFQFHSREEAQAENYRRMFLAIANDYQVLIIKLVDRLHNLRTLQFLNEEKQKRIAKESLDIYAPLAHRLGIGKIKDEIEELSFYYLHPEEYYNIKELVDMNSTEQHAHIESMIQDLKNLLEKHTIKGSISGRAKQIHSIYQKIHLKNIPFNKLYDIYGLRILVDSNEACYTALGIVHSVFKPLPDRFKDYIALPKANGYQSLHTTIVDNTGIPTEVQIRTKEMDLHAKYGYAAHWQYKGNSKHKQQEKSLKWIQSIIEENKDLSPLDYLESIKDDLYMDDIFVFTPNGDVKVLAQGSTVLDFAYQIHTEVGHRCKGCLVNSEIVTLDYELKNGDMIEVLTNKHENPKVDWLHIVKSRQARHKIKQWLNKQNKDVLIDQGKKRLEKAFALEGLNLERSLKDIKLTPLKDHFHLSDINDLYLYIEQGDLGKKEVIKYFLDELHPKPEPTIQVKKTTINIGDTTGVRILGETNIAFTLAKCCSPIPGDAILGITVIEKGVSVHRTDCANMLLIQEKSPEKILEVSWDTYTKTEQRFACIINIDGYDRAGILQDLLRIIYDSQVTLNACNTKSSKDQTKMRAKLAIEIKNVKEFFVLKNKLMAIPDVYSVTRESIGFK